MIAADMTTAPVRPTASRRSRGCPVAPHAVWLIGPMTRSAVKSFPPGELAARADAELAVGGRQVRLDRLDAQEQLGCDGAVALAGLGQLADLALAGRQRAGTRERGSARP